MQVIPSLMSVLGILSVLLFCIVVGYIIAKAEFREVLIFRGLAEHDCSGSVVWKSDRTVV